MFPWYVSWDKATLQFTGGQRTEPWRLKNLKWYAYWKKALGVTVRRFPVVNWSIEQQYSLKKAVGVQEKKKFLFHIYYTVVVYWGLSECQSVSWMFSSSSNSHHHLERKVVLSPLSGKETQAEGDQITCPALQNYSVRAELSTSLFLALSVNQKETKVNGLKLERANQGSALHCNTQ